MIKLMVILTGLFLFSRSVFPADETNKTPPVDRGSAVAQSAMADKSPAVAPASPEAMPRQAKDNGIPADSGAQLRDPFWPIGFIPAAMAGGAFRPAGSERDKKTAGQISDLSGILRIGGVIRKGSKFYATVNGFTVQTGEVISVIIDGEIYKFVIEEIDFNKVQFKPVKR